MKFDFLLVRSCGPPPPPPEGVSSAFLGESPFATPPVAFLRWYLLIYLGAPLWKPLACVINFKFGEKLDVIAGGEEILGRFEALSPLWLL